MSRRGLAIVIVNVVVLVVLAELLGLAIYYFQNGALFYVHRKTYPTFPETQSQTLTADRLHPYFGPTHVPGHPFGDGAATNNFGFVSPHDYPFTKRSDDELIIGVFGGSVGVWFCQQGADRLTESLKRHETLRSRDLVVLCFSHEGYKQPQQLQVLTYFLSIGQQFDLVLNIDGFNEVALSRLNDQRGLDISMPSVTHIDPLINLVDQSTLTPEKLASLSAISRDKERLNELAGRLAHSRFASEHFVLEQYFEIVSKRHLAELFTFARLPSNPARSSLVYVTPKTRARDEPALFDDIATNWTSASILMNALLASRGARYFHVLQPNQYYTDRRFGPGEAKVAQSDTSPFRESVEKGYPVLLARSGSGVWEKNGVRFLDATRILDDEPSPVYMDDCCHYTALGNRLLADFIAERIKRSL
ncbi:MAG: hypothetical protein ACRD26_09345 [Vicinamibacterales bacterium]